MDWHKESFTGKAKAAHTGKAKQGTHSLPICRQVFNHLQESRAFIMQNGLLEWQMPSLQMFPPSSSPSFVGWAWCRMVWNIPLVSWGQLSRLCPFPTTCAPSAHLLVGWGEKQKRLWLLSNNSYISVLSTFFLYWIQNTALYQLLGQKLTVSQPKPGQAPKSNSNILITKENALKWMSLTLVGYVLYVLLSVRITEIK